MNSSDIKPSEQLMKMAEEQAELILSEMKKENAETKRKHKKSLIKLTIMLILLAIIIAFSTIAWFTMNREVGSSGMGMKSQASLFEIKTSGSAGLYDNYIIRIDDKYSGENETTPSSSKLILRLTNENQIDNLWKKNTAPTQDDLDRIKKLESTEYGLSPGDHGVLKFSIVPTHEDSDNFSVSIKPIVSCYKTEYYTTEDTGHTVGYQKDVITAMDPDDPVEGAAIGFTNTHISMYYKADEDDDGEVEMHLIRDKGFVVSDINSEVDVEIYWFWPEELSGILDLDIEDMDLSGETELRKEFFAAPDEYLEKINNYEDFSNIAISKEGTESARNIQAQNILESPTTYNYYSNRYNNADQTIGDKVGYILVEIVADQSN